MRHPGLGNRCTTGPIQGRVSVQRTPSANTPRRQGPRPGALRGRDDLGDQPVHRPRSGHHHPLPRFCLPQLVGHRHPAARHRAQCLVHPRLHGDDRQRHRRDDRGAAHHHLRRGHERRGAHPDALPRRTAGRQATLRCLGQGLPRSGTRHVSDLPDHRHRIPDPVDFLHPSHPGIRTVHRRWGLHRLHPRLLPAALRAYAQPSTGTRPATGRAHQHAVGLGGMARADLCPDHAPQTQRTDHFCHRHRGFLGAAHFHPGGQQTARGPERGRPAPPGVRLLRGGLCRGAAL